MKSGARALILVWLLAITALGDPPTPGPSAVAQPTPAKRGWVGRLLHPFSSSRPPKYKNPKLHGLSVQLQISPQPIRLSEVRQLEIKATVTNTSKGQIELFFPNDQRIEIYLLNSAGVVLTKWSDNHAVSPKPQSVLINPGEQLEYNETIATRDLTPKKVFVAEVFFPDYPELQIRQKFFTEP